MKKKYKNLLSLKPKNRAVVLRYLKKLEKRQPKTVYYLNLFDSGIVVSSKQIERILIEILKNVV